MSKSFSERRLAENEAIYRQYNERVSEGFAELDRVAEEEGARRYWPTHQSLHFYCECSNLQCAERVQCRLDDYISAHRNRRHFIVVPGHQVRSIEKVVEAHPDYVVVEKFQDPPEKPLSK